MSVNKKSKQPEALQEARLKITADAREFNRLLNEVAAYRKKHPRLFKNALGFLFKSPDLLEKLARIESHDSPARADEVIMRFEPTDFFRKLCAALRAGNLHDFALKHGTSL